MTGRPLWTLIWREGKLIGLVGAALTAVDFALQAWRRAMGWPLDQFALLYLANIAAVALLSVVAGFLLARRTGNRAAGTWAGSVTPVFSVIVATLATICIQFWLQGTALFTSGLLQSLLILALGGVVLGGALGFGLGYVGAYGGYLVWRRHDPVYLAHRAELRMMTFKERRTRWIKEELAPSLVGAFFLVPLTGVVAVPILLLFQLSARWPDVTVLLSLAFIATSVAIVLLFRHTVKARLVSDWLACVCFAAGIWLMMSATALEGLAYLVNGMVIPIIYISSVIAGIARMMLPPQADADDVADEVEAERPAMLFRDDGTILVFYPSRSTLAVHALFAGVVGGGVLLVAVLVSVLPSFLQWGLGLFGVMALLFGFLPDLIRLLVRWPSLTVNAAGLVDAGSAHLFGFGLIPWDDVETVFPTRGNLGRGQFAELVIIADRLPQLLAALPWWKRFPLKLIDQFRLGVPISSLLLEQPPEQVAKQIVAYVKSHAPPAYLETVFDEEEE